MLQKSSDLNSIQSIESTSLYDAGYIEVENIELSFNAMMTCTNAQCRENIMLLGSGFVDQEVEEDETGGWTPTYVSGFTVKYFQPFLRIIKVPPNTPESIIAPLEQSFALFFCDSDACGNKIRVCVEAIMDECGVDRMVQTKKSQDRRLNLHERIERLQEDQNTKLQLEAIKWLGNTASHGAEGLSKQDTLDAYEILSFVLSKMFDDTESRINALAGNIKDAKGPVRKQRFQHIVD